MRKRSRKRGHALEADGGDHFVGEFFGADVGEAQRGIAPLERVADGLHQVRLAESHTTVEEERVVGFGGLLGDGDGRGVRELVRGADDERVERVARVQLVVGRSRNRAWPAKTPAGLAAGSGSASAQTKSRAQLAACRFRSARLASSSPYVSVRRLQKSRRGNADDQAVVVQRAPAAWDETRWRNYED